MTVTVVDVCYLLIAYCQVTCGFAYTIAVGEHGHVYSWGAGECGRLGLGDNCDRLVPTVLTSLENVTVQSKFLSIRNKFCDAYPILLSFTLPCLCLHPTPGAVAGSVHTCILTDIGHVYSCGKFEYTGHGATSDVLQPQMLDAFGGSAVRSISIGPGGASYWYIVMEQCIICDRIPHRGAHRAGGSVCVGSQSSESIRS